MDFDQFKKVSIRGRMAYGICCFENVLLHYSLKGDGWCLLLSKLWEFTSAQNKPIFLNENNKLFKTQLDDWFNVVEYLPNNILEFDSYYNGVDEDYDMLKEEEFNLLHSTYQDSNDLVNNIADLLFQLGAEELYTGIQGFSSGTLKVLQQIIKTIQKQGINLPDISAFKQYVFQSAENSRDCYGWGQPFDGRIYSKILKNCIKN